MSYIIVVNPGILAAAGIPRGPSMVATILTAMFGTLVMGLYAKRPFAVAPYMGENAFVAYTVVGVMGFSWQTALGGIFLAGVLFTLLTLFRVRGWLVGAIPASLKNSFSAGIGLFLLFIGLNETGFVSLGVAGSPVRLGRLSAPPALLAILGFVLMGLLMARGVRGAIPAGILAVTAISFAVGITPLPSRWVSLPPSLAPIALKLDVAGALRGSFLSVILTIFVMDLLDTMGTLLGLSARAGLLDERGELPEIEKPMLADALATMGGALLGTTTSGAYVESAAGIEAGGRTGLTAVTIAALFGASLFFAPVLTAIPAHAYGPALMIVGLLMLEPVARLPFDNFGELVPAAMTMALMVLTMNVGVGMTAGFVLYPLFQVLAGRTREVRAGMWVLAALSLAFFLLYPY